MTPQVITTVNYPTDTIKLLAAADTWKVLVVADRKTPADWSSPNVILLSIEEQQHLSYSVMALLPFNHYGCGVCRVHVHNTPQFAHTTYAQIV